MFKLLPLSIVFAVAAANAGVIQLCGDVKGFNNFPISHYSDVSVIELQTERPFPVLLYDKRDLEAAIKVVSEIEGLDDAVNFTAVRFSHDPDAVYPRYSNFKMAQSYFACARVFSGEDQVSYKTTVSFELYLNAQTMLTPIYIRD